MKDFVSRRRYELLGLGVSLLFAAAHVWVDAQPAAGLRVGGGDGQGAFVRAAQLFEGRATDVQFRLRGPVAPHPAVVVVAIDERSVQRFGLWPWSRTYVAQALDRLREAGAKTVGLDVAFIDESKLGAGPWKDLLQRFDQAVQGSPDGLAPPLAAFRAALVEGEGASPDEALARAFRAFPKVVQGVIAYGAHERSEFSAEVEARNARLLEPHLIRSTLGGMLQLPVARLNGWVQHSAQAPLPLFAEAGTRVGHFNMVPEVDGSVRRSPVLARLDGPMALLPSLALQTAAEFLGAKVEPAYVQGEAMLTGVWLKPAEGPSLLVPYKGGEPFTLVNHVGPPGVFRTLSIVDVIDGTFDPSAVRGKAVLVGMTLTGNTGDARVTPFHEMVPGVYIHASLLSNILSGAFLRRPQGSVLFEALALLLAGGLLSVSLPRLRSFWLKGLVMLGALVAWAAVDQALFSRGYEVASVLPLAGLATTSFSLIFLGYLSMDRDRLQLRSTFSKYLGGDVMEEALRNPDKLNRGEKREMTVLFSDVRGFTTLSERMLPEKLAEFMKEYLTPMTQIVFEEKGTLDKYIGDAVMAFWNAPLDQADHAERACRASVKFLKKLEELKQRWRDQGYPEVDIGVGISTGPMIVGNMGSDVRVDYTVMGDAVNLGSRLEGTNKEYETRIIASEVTYQQAKGAIIFRRLGAVRVKGKRRPVGIYEVRGVGQAQGAEAQGIERFEAALDAYTEGDFAQAEERFRAVLEVWPDDAPTLRYLDEVEGLRGQPTPNNWDGVFTATTK